MHRWRSSFIFACLFWLATLLAGRAETKLLTVPEGHNILLPTLPKLNLQDGSEILWSFKPEENAQAQTLVHVISGKWDQFPPESFRNKVNLSITSGALTLGPVGLGHSGYYHGQITGGDNTVHHFEFKISVINPGPTPSRLTTETPRNISSGPKAVTAVAIAVPILVLILSIIIIIIKVRKQKEKETNSSSSSVSMDMESGTHQGESSPLTQHRSTSEANSSSSSVSMDMESGTHQGESSPLTQHRSTPGGAAAAGGHHLALSVNSPC